MEKSNILVTITAGLLISTSITTMTMAMEHDEPTTLLNFMNEELDRVAIPEGNSGLESLTASVMNVGDSFKELFHESMAEPQSEIALVTKCLTAQKINNQNSAFGLSDIAEVVDGYKMNNKDKAMFCFRTFLALGACDPQCTEELYSDSPQKFTSTWKYISSQIADVDFYNEFNKIFKDISDESDNFASYSRLLFEAMKKLATNSSETEEIAAEKINNKLLKYIISLENVVDDREKTDGQVLISEFTELEADQLESKNITTVDNNEKSNLYSEAKKKLKKTDNKYEEKVQSEQAMLALYNDTVYKVVATQVSGILRRTFEKLEQAGIEVIDSEKTQSQDKAQNTAKTNEIATTLKNYLNEYCGADESGRTVITEKYVVTLNRLRINAAMKASGDNRSFISDSFDNSPTNSVMPMEIAAEKDPKIHTEIAALDVITKLIDRLNSCTKEQRSNFVSALNDSFEKAFEDAIARTHSSKARMKNLVSSALATNLKKLVEAEILLKPQPKDPRFKISQQNILIDSKTVAWKKLIADKVVDAVRAYLALDTFAKKRCKEAFNSELNKIKTLAKLNLDSDLSATGLKKLPNDEKRQVAIALSVTLKAIEVGFALEGHLDIVKEALGLAKSAAEKRTERDDQHNNAILSAMKSGVRLKKVESNSKEVEGNRNPDTAPKQIVPATIGIEHDSPAND